MGEARRRREAELDKPCPCRSGRPGRFCCFDGERWYKRPANLGLAALPKATAIEKCYLKDGGSCVGPISGEHIISEAVIRLLMGGGDFSVSGLPWLQAGEERVLSPKNLVANCLCSKHNSALHPLDDAALLFFENLNLLLEGDEQTPHLLVSGHDMERWLLKTAKAMAVSKSFSLGRERFLGDFLPGDSMLQLLDTCEAWPDRVGLYGVMKSGDDFLNHRRFQMRPYFDDDAIVALG
jgi:hypothetical protein